MPILFFLSCLFATTAMHLSMSTDSQEGTMTNETVLQWTENGVRSWQQCVDFFSCGDLNASCFIGCSADGYDGDIVQTSSSFVIADTPVSSSVYQMYWGFPEPLGLVNVNTCEEYCGRTQDLFVQISRDSAFYFANIWFFTYYSSDVRPYGPWHSLDASIDDVAAVWSEYATSAFDGETEPIETCENSCHARGVLDVDTDWTDAVCPVGLSKGNGVIASDNWPYVTAECIEVDCPSYSTGVSVADGCVCEDGFTGVITATNVSPYYSGSCQEDFSNSAVLSRVSSLIWLSVIIGSLST